MDEYRGFLYKTVQAINSAPVSDIASQLGRYLMMHEITVAQAAKQLNISRMAVYNILHGKSKPRKTLEAEIEAMISEPPRFKQESESETAY